MVVLKQADAQPDARRDTLGPSAEARPHTHMQIPRLGLIVVFQLAAEGRQASRLPSGATAAGEKGRRRDGRMDR